ncbi:MAG: serine protease [Thermoanaerobaculia bacterium]|nr:serine protease [Thermoanaerobaculia bacterium]
MFMLLSLGVIGVALNLLVLLDIPILRPPSSSDYPPSGGPVLDDPSLREAVYLVKVASCSGTEVHQGTAFAVTAEYLITCAHVVSEAQKCGAPIRVVDFTGVDQTADLGGYAEGTDLALLSIHGSAKSVLPLADSTLFESSDKVLRVFTVGYPLVGAASTEERSSISSVGVISQYERANNRFITSGLNVNPGNSGGPVIFEDVKLVLGVASAKLSSDVGDGIAYVITSESVRAFFLETTGQALE